MNEKLSILCLFMIYFIISLNRRKNNEENVSQNKNPNHLIIIFSI